MTAKTSNQMTAEETKLKNAFGIDSDLFNPWLSSVFAGSLVAMICTHPPTGKQMDAGYNEEEEEDDKDEHAEGDEGAKELRATKREERKEYDERWNVRLELHRTVLRFLVDKELRGITREDLLLHVRPMGIQHMDVMPPSFEPRWDTDVETPIYRSREDTVSDEELRTTYTQLRYRLSQIAAANTYVAVLGIPLPNGLQCEQTAMDEYSGTMIPQIDEVWSTMMES